MAERKYKCMRCNIIVTVASGSPDYKLGGPCPKDSSGNHHWTSA